MPNPDWKYGDILRPTDAFLGSGYEVDRVMFLTDEAGMINFFFAVNLNLAVDNEVWMGHILSWEPDTDA